MFKQTKTNIYTTNNVIVSHLNQSELLISNYKRVKQKVKTKFKKSFDEGTSYRGSHTHSKNEKKKIVGPLLMSRSNDKNKTELAHKQTPTTQEHNKTEHYILSLQLTLQLLESYFYDLIKSI